MSDPSRSKTVLVVAVAAVLLGVAGWQLWKHWNSPTGKDQLPPGPISAEQAQRLIELKNRGLGDLENGRYAEAAKAFEQIVRELPEEPLGHRNLAVARVLEIKALTADRVREDPVRAAKLRKQAEEAVKAAIAAEPEAAVPHVLAARLSGKLADAVPDGDSFREQTIASLEMATERDGGAAYIWYELFEAHDLLFSDANRNAAGDALKRAYESQPDNLAVLQRWLMHQSRTKDPEIVATLESARTGLRPIAARLRRESGRFDLDRMLNDAIAGVKRNDAKGWSIAGGLASILNARHATKLDRREIQPHELEFVITDFRAAFYKRAQLPEPKLPAAIPVTLKGATGGRQLPPVQNVRAIKLVDFDLGGRNDVIAVQKDRVQVFGFRSEGNRWAVIAEFQLPFAASGVVAADLDFDFKRPAADRNKPVKAQKPWAVNAPPPFPKCATADVDLVVWGPGGIAVVRNDVDPRTGQRRLRPVKQSAEFQNLNGCLAAAVADFDHDSDLDLIVSTDSGISLWSNRGDATFDDVTQFSSLPKADFQPTVVVPIDFNRDAHIDVVLGDPASATSGYLQNLRHGQLRFQSFGPKFSAMGNARALCPVEADGNVSWDWVRAGAKGIALTHTQSFDNGRYQPLKATTIDKTPVDGAKLWDYDNDGYRDVLAWSTAGFLVYRGGPGGVFQKTEGLFVPVSRDVSAADVADVDGDGDLDVVASVANRLTLYVNEGGNKNNWIDVELHAQEADIK
ncbi:MAG: FG-GAP-like repeat-containing protein, partial [Planctomycetaceae bacterium]